MRAWRVRNPGEPKDVLHLDEVALPEPGLGQLRVRVSAAGIGLPDVLMCRHTYPLTPSGSFTPGQEVTGTVTAAGPDTAVAIGSQWLAVLGAAGGSGVAAVQLGHALGARVVAVVSDAERAEFCLSLGADAAIDLRDGDLAIRLRAVTFPPPGNAWPTVRSSAGWSW